MATRLILTAIAPNQPRMANGLIDLVLSYGVDITESHMTVMSKEFAVIMEIAGSWNALTKLEHQLPVKAHALSFLTMIKRSESVSYDGSMTPFRVVFQDVSDRAKSLISITEFFAEHSINIEELNCRTLLSPQSDEQVAELKFTISLSIEQNPDELRSKFKQFCTEHNLTAQITLLKNQY
ncbi:MAG: hypothetical protein HWE27_13140 [Gammaproteobacteria bacterium]|nr:hypothetical protein [Gammaproteobacteria bacterium]